jgi:hypothetical protein
MERIWELEMAESLSQRLSERSEAVKVNIKDL